MRQEPQELRLPRRTPRLAKGTALPAPTELTTPELIAARDAAFEETITFGLRRDASHDERVAELSSLAGGDDSLVSQIAQQLQQLEEQREQLASLLARLEERA